MTTRAERIAERIREQLRIASEGLGSDDVAYSFRNGEYDDLLGPEVTEEVLRDLREVLMTSEMCWDSARNACTVAKYHRADKSVHMAHAMRWRRLAKFMRALERSAQRG